MAQNPENPLNNLGLKIAAVYLQQKADTTGQLRDGMVSGDVESVSGSVAGIKTVLYEAQVMKEEIDKQIVAIRETLGYLPSIRFSLITQHGFPQGVTEVKPEPGEVVEQPPEEPKTLFTPPIAEELPEVKEPVVIAEPLGFFVQEDPINVVSEPENVIDNTNTPAVQSRAVAEPEPEGFEFDFESQDEVPVLQPAAGSPTWVDRRQFVPEVGELTFSTEVMPNTQVTTLVKAITDAHRAGKLAEAGISLRRIDLGTLQGLASDQDLADLKKLSPDEQDDVMYGIVEKLMDYSKNPVRTLQDEIGHDGYLLLDLLGPSIRSREQVLDLIDALPFENRPDFRALYTFFRSPKSVQVQEAPKKLTDVQLNRKLAGGDSALTKRDLFRFQRETKPSKSRKKVVSPEAQATYKFLENFGDYVKYDERGVLVVDKPVGVASFGNDKIRMGVIDAATVANDGDPFYFLNNLDKQSSGLFVLFRDPRLRDSLLSDYRLGIPNIEYIYAALLQGRLDKTKNIQAFINSAAETKRVTMKISPVGLYRNSLGMHVTHSEVTVTGSDNQVLATMAESGNSVLGDYRYSKGAGVSAARPMLHVQEVKLTNPLTGEPLPKIVADLPEDFKELVSKRLILVEDLKQV